MYSNDIDLGSAIRVHYLTVSQQGRRSLTRAEIDSPRALIVGLPTHSIKRKTLHNGGIDSFIMWLVCISYLFTNCLWFQIELLTLLAYYVY